MHDRVPGAPGQYKASVSAEELAKMQAGEQFVITMARDDQPIKEGTPYSKAAVLPDDVAAEICPDVPDPTPADAFRSLAKKTAEAANGNFRKMAFLGNDPVTVATDTPAAWIALGDGFAGITTVCTANQPNQYGAVISLIVNNFNVHQIFIGTDADMSFRAGNLDSGWIFNWRSVMTMAGGIHLTEGVDYGNEFTEKFLNEAEVGTVFGILAVSEDG